MGKRLDVDNVFVKTAMVNQAQKGRRRTYRAHGRINAYLSSNCHVELTFVERATNVKKEKNVAPEQRSLSVKRKVRAATASAMRQRKWVQVGKKEKKEKKEGGKKEKKEKNEKKRAHCARCLVPLSSLRLG